MSIRFVFVLVATLSLKLAADVPGGTTYVRRLHRVGYEALPSVWAFFASPLFWHMLVAVVLCGLILRRREMRLKLKSSFVSVFRKKALRWVFVGAAISTLTAFGCLLLWPETGESDEKGRHDELMRARKERVGEWVTVHSDEPGWKYPDKIGEGEKSRLKARIRKIRGELQRAVDESGVKIQRAARWQKRHGEVEQEEKAICEVLKKNWLLKFKCMGIPIEWLATEVRWSYATSCFEDF